MTLIKKLSMCLEMSCDELLADQEIYITKASFVIALPF